MKKYIIKRFLLLIPIITMVMIISFFITRIMPGDPIRMMLGDFASEEQVLEAKIKLGYDKSLYQQFIIWLKGVLKGDFGVSLFLHKDVKEIMISRLEPTILLAILGESIGILIGIPLGIIAAINHKTKIDQMTIGISLLGVSMPSFFLSLLLILFFGQKLMWFPIYGYQSFFDVGFSCFKYLVLPSIALGFMQSGIIARMTRSSMLEVLNEDYIRTARAKGISEFFVIFFHALKNAMIPIATIIGFSMAVLLGGTWVIESIFNINGIGALAINSIINRDYPVIQACMIFSAFIYLFINLIVDLSYAIFNPRLRLK
ncbi:ABC transporter permease [Peptostreptococcaceae bacterium AGR-M142]